MSLLVIDDHPDLESKLSSFEPAVKRGATAVSISRDDLVKTTRRDDGLFHALRKES